MRVSEMMLLLLIKVKYNLLPCVAELVVLGDIVDR